MLYVQSVCMCVCMSEHELTYVCMNESPFGELGMRQNLVTFNSPTQGQIKLIVCKQCLLMICVFTLIEL